MHLWRRGTHERQGHDVLCRIAALQMSNSIIGRTGRLVMFMSRKPMVMLRMIVIVVGVGVQHRHHAGRRNQHMDEQQRQDTVHEVECMRRGR